MDHGEVIKKIERIEKFFPTIGLKKTRDLPINWNLDSVIKYEPIKSNYTLNYKGQDRILISVDIGIMGGVAFVLSGKIGTSVYETIRTDYDFVGKYESVVFFKDELRNWIIDHIL